MFLAARAFLLSMRASEDFGCAEKLSAAEQIKPDCCRTPAVVFIFTDSAACVLSFYHRSITFFLSFFFSFLFTLQNIVKHGVGKGVVCLLFICVNTKT